MKFYSPYYAEVMVLLHLFPLTKANLFEVHGELQHGYILVNFVAKSFYNQSCLLDCIVKCEENSTCQSINWFPDTGLCELNCATHWAYPDHRVVNSSGDYFPFRAYNIVNITSPKSSCDNKLCSSSKVCAIDKYGKGFNCLANCTAPLGMEDGRIKDSQITASSYRRLKLAPHRGRLHSIVLDGGWVPDLPYTVGSWLQIDLLKQHIISKVATQGRNMITPTWVTHYYLSYSLDGLDWESYKLEGCSPYSEFIGNVDESSVVTNTLPAPMRTRMVRFNVLKWNTPGIAMRVELYGCEAP